MNEICLHCHLLMKHFRQKSTSTQCLTMALHQWCITSHYVYRQKYASRVELANLKRCICEVCNPRGPISQGLSVLEYETFETKVNQCTVSNTGTTLAAHRITLRLPLERASRVELAMMAFYLMKNFIPVRSEWDGLNSAYLKANLYLNMKHFSQKSNIAQCLTQALHQRRIVSPYVYSQKVIAEQNLP